MDTVKIAIVGYGTIGSGVARLLLEHADRIARQGGKRLELVHVVDPDLKRPRNFALPPGVLTADSRPGDSTTGRSWRWSSWSAGWSPHGASS